MLYSFYSYVLAYSLNIIPNLLETILNKIVYPQQLKSQHTAKVEIILDGGIRRGTHVLKALALGAKACSFGKAYLFALGAAGQQGIEALLQKMKAEINRDMILMGCQSIKELNRSKVTFRKN